MLVKDFITKEIPVLKSFDTGEYALALMDDYKVKHLPLLADDYSFYRLLVSERELLSASDISLPLEQLNIMDNYSLHADAHILEALSLISGRGLSLLPVVSEEGEYLGSLTREHLVDSLAELCQADAAGSILVLDLLPIDYSLVDIARLVESNHAHVMSLLSQVNPQTGRLLITLKIDLEDASVVLRSFERFNYTVLGYFMKNSLVDDIFQQRMNEVIHYINI